MNDSKIGSDGTESTKRQKMQQHAREEIVTIHLPTPFEQMVLHFLDMARKDLNNYTSAQVWRSTFRLVADQSMKMVRILASVSEFAHRFPSLHTTFQSLEKDYLVATKGRTLVQISNSLHDKDGSVLLFLDPTPKDQNETGGESTAPVSSKDDIDDVVKRIQVYKKQVETQRLNQDIASGRIVLHLENCERSLKENLPTYWRESRLFLQAGKPHDYRLDRLLEQWPAGQPEDHSSLSAEEYKEKFDLFKSLLEEFGHSLSFLNKVVTRLNCHPVYLDYLLCDWAIRNRNECNHINRMQITNLLTLKTYYKAHQMYKLSNAEFAMWVVGQCKIWDKNRRDDPSENPQLLRELFDFVWSLPDTGLPSERSEQKLVDWMKRVDGNNYDCLKRFIVCGYIRWNLEQLVTSMNKYEHDLDVYTREKKQARTRGEIKDYDVLQKWRKRLDEIEDDRVLIVQMMRYSPDCKSFFETNERGSETASFHGDKLETLHQRVKAWVKKHTEIDDEFDNFESSSDDEEEMN